MSWKSLTSAAFICLLAAMPAMAVPSMTATLLGLDTNGNWQWQVSVTPDASLYTFTDGPDAVGGSVAVELGVKATGRELVSGGADYNGTNFLSENLGLAPATFPAIVGGAQDGFSDLDVNATADQGIVVDLANDRLVAFLGSAFFTTGGAKQMLLVTTDRPTATSLTTALETVGAYAQDLSGGMTVADGVVMAGNKALIAQGGKEFAVNTVYSKAVVSGNVNLDDKVNIADLTIFGGFYNPSYVGPARRWQDGDFTGDGIVNIGDFTLLGGTYHSTNSVDPNWGTGPNQGSVSLTPVSGVGSGSGSSLASSSVPEPSTLVLILLAGLASLRIAQTRQR